MRSSRVAWKIVEKHRHEFEKLVNAAIAGGYLSYQDRGDAIRQCEVSAFRLAQREDVANYLHLLRRTVKWNLFGVEARLWADATDRVLIDRKSKPSVAWFAPNQGELSEW
jgi:hypothetical protein